MASTVSGSIDLKAFVSQNAPYMTVSDMVEETGATTHAIQKVLGELGIDALKQKDKIKNFILSYYKKKPKKWFQKVCDMSDVAVNAYYRELGIDEPDFESKVPAFLNRSAREILSSLKLDDANHWVEPY